MRKNWIVEGNIVFGQDFLTLLKSKSFSQLSNLQPLIDIEFLCVDIKLKINQWPTISHENEDTRNTGAFILMLSGAMPTFNKVENLSDTVLVDGFCLILIITNSFGSNENEFRSYLTYRFFPRETKLSKEYLDIIVDSMSKLISKHEFMRSRLLRDSF